MWLIWIGLVLMILHFAGIGPFAGLPWWGWGLPFLLAIFWFEVIERRFGLDRKKDYNEMDQAKRKRIRKALGDRAPSAQKGRTRR
jgi:small Trp-rich protein